MCDCKNTITLGSGGCSFHPDEDPYQNGIIEDVTDEENSTIDDINFHMTATLCMKCKKVYFWSEDGISLGEQEIA